jgi:hypothetical protein
VVAERPDCFPDWFTVNKVCISMAINAMFFLDTRHLQLPSLEAWCGHGGSDPRRLSTPPCALKEAGYTPAPEALYRPPGLMWWHLMHDQWDKTRTLRQYAACEYMDPEAQHQPHHHTSCVGFITRNSKLNHTSLYCYIQYNNLNKPWISELGNAGKQVTHYYFSLYTHHTSPRGFNNSLYRPRGVL